MTLWCKFRPCLAWLEIGVNSFRLNMARKSWRKYAAMRIQADRWEKTRSLRKLRNSWAGHYTSRSGDQKGKTMLKTSPINNLVRCPQITQKQTRLPLETAIDLQPGRQL